MELEQEFDFEDAIKAYQRAYAQAQLVDPGYARHCLTMIDLLKMDQMEAQVVQHGATGAASSLKAD